MVDISYRVVPRAKHRFDVEMARPNGRPKIIEGFGSEHEANAWIVQTQRMIRATGPWTPLAPRKPNAATDVLMAPPAPLEQPEQKRVPDTSDHAAPRRAHVRTMRERATSKS
jgi:hypothetical protein